MFLAIYCDHQVPNYVNLHLCRRPRQLPVFATAYFMVFIIIVSMVLMSLFMGAVSLNMCNAMLALKAKNAKVHTSKHERDLRARIRHVLRKVSAIENVEKKRSKWEMLSPRKIIRSMGKRLPR